MEGGPPIFRQDCSCPALLEDCRSGFPYGAVTRYGPPFQTLPVPKSTATGLVRFRSPLLAESRLMSIPPATEMFQFAGFASRAYEFSTGYPLKSCPLGVGCPIRRSRDQRSLASPPGFSQRAASFIASQCQGIHQMPLIRARSAGIPKRSYPPGTHPGKPPRTGASPICRKTTLRIRANPGRNPRMKTLLSDRPRSQASACARGPSASVTFTNPLHPSTNASPATAPAMPAGPRAIPAVPDPARPPAATEPNLCFSEPRFAARPDQTAQATPPISTRPADGKPAR